jgi:hypothetical protein
MIYFSTNNDLHFYLTEKIISELGLKHSEIILIIQKGSRNQQSMDCNYSKILLSDFPTMRMRRPLLLLNAMRHKKKIMASIDFKKEDTFIFFTEYELNNHCFAKKMKKVGGRVYLFDEGIGFYFGNSPYHTSDKFTKKEKINRFRTDIPLKVLRIPAFNKIDQEGFSLTLRDMYIDAIFSSLRLPIKRSVPIWGYKHFDFIPQCFPSKDKALFITSSMKLYDIEKEEFEISERILCHLQKNFKDVYLKIHPGDYVFKTNAFYFFSKFIRDNPDIKAIDNNCLAEEATAKYGIGLIVSSMSTALFNVSFMGCEPVFFYHLLPDRKNLGVYNFTLKELGYNFIKEISDITPFYHSGFNPEQLTYDKELYEYSQLFN